MSDSKRPTTDDLPLFVLALVAQVINPEESEKYCGLEKHGRHLRQNAIAGKCKSFRRRRDGDLAPFSQAFMKCIRFVSPYIFGGDSLKAYNCCDCGFSCSHSSGSLHTHIDARLVSNHFNLSNLKRHGGKRY